MVSVSAAPITGTGLPANRHRVRSTSASLRSGRWWKSATRRAPAMVPSRDRVFGGRMAERPFGFHLLGPEVGVVNQEIDVVGQPEGASWYSPMPPGPGPSAVGQWSGM